MVGPAWPAISSAAVYQDLLGVARPASAVSLAGLLALFTICSAGGRLGENPISRCNTPLNFVLCSPLQLLERSLSVFNL